MTRIGSIRIVCRNMIPFNDLRPLQELLADELRAATERVLQSGWYILGPEVEEFEAAFASYHGVAHAVGVATGTDAIELALRAAGVGPGDEVITVAHTAVATVCAVERAGATPVLVDIDRDSYTMDPAAAEAAITPRTRAIVPVHLYGHPADMQSLTAIAQRHGLLLIEDCAQAHGARYHGQLAGTFGDLAAFSFYPTKNLGAYGDGGAVITRDDALAARLRRLRNYGQEQRYHAVERGMNSRLDEMQAAILRVKLRHLDEHNARRRQIAAAYTRLLHGVETPRCCPDAAAIQHVFHLYVVRHRRRGELRAALHRQGIAPQVHYPVPVHLQQAYADLGYARGSLPVTERAADEILSLPLYVGLLDEQVGTVARALNQSIEELAHARAA
ncbi:MAG: DegT/DnrJ/EryC1/StrS family aminotransferase [Candidatus Hydrogenedentales bacterium]